MISFENRGGKYRIKLSGDRDKFFVTDVEQMKLAIEHYFGSLGHAFHREGCPLCEAIRKRDGG